MADYETDLNTLSTNQILEIYNEAAGRLGKQEVNKFSDKESAVRRTKKILEEADSVGLIDEIAGENKGIEMNTQHHIEENAATEAETAETAVKPEKVKKAKKVKVEKAGNDGRRGKLSRSAGKHIYSTKETNPRRLNTHGWRSMEIIINNPGITYEDFLKAGGRNMDLLWDIPHGNVTIEDTLRSA